MAKKVFTDESLAAFVDEIKTYTDSAVSTKADSSHSHDSRYYTETEVNNLLGGKANTTHGNHVPDKETANNARFLRNDNSWQTVTPANIGAVANTTYNNHVSSHAPNNAEKNVIVGIQKNGTDLTVNSSTRKVNITVPTQASDIGAAPSSHKHDDLYDIKGAAAAVQTNLNTVDDKVDDHLDDTSSHVTTGNKSNWNTAYSHSQGAHARTDATKVEDSTTNGNIKINGAETNVYSHPNSGVTAGTYRSVTVNAQGHVTGGTNPTTLNEYGITDAETKSDANEKLEEAKNYTNSKTSGLASTTVVDNKISSHNTSTASHNDIRVSINELTTRLNALADSDDTTLDQLSEIVAYIKSNKTLIDSVTTNKINTSDIIDNLTTSSTSKVLSAKQGVAIKSLIDNLRTAIDGKQAAITGAATTIASSNLTASRALISNGSGKVAVSSVTSTEIGYLSGVKKAVQTQLDEKLNLSGGTLTGNLTISSGGLTSDTVSASNTFTLSAGSTIYTNRGASTSFIFQKGGTEHARFDTAGHFITGASSTYDIGSSAKAWRNVYADKFIGALQGNADTATFASSAAKLTTARTIGIGNDFSGSATFNGSANVTISAKHYNCDVNSGNVANLPWHRIAYTGDVTNNYHDKDMIIMINSKYHNGKAGILKVSLRTDSITTGASASVSAIWLVRKGFSVDDVKIALYKTTGKAYADLYLKVGTYARCTVYQLSGNRTWTLVSSTEHDSSSTNTPVECYASIESAATTLYNLAYTSIASSTEDFAVNYANSAGSSTKVTTTSTNPSSTTAYYFPFHSGNGTGSKSLLSNNGIGYWTKEGTTSATGLGELFIGNNTASGTAGNKQGKLYLYGTSSGYTSIVPTNNTTSNIVLSLPSTGGTLALNTAATQSANGLMSAADKTKLDGIATGANKITVDTALSDSSTNPVQNKVVNAALAGKANSSHGTHVPAACTTITDWDSAITTGWYMGNSASNAPSTGWYMGYVIAHNGNYVLQEVYQFTASTDARAINKYIRAKMNGTWGIWSNVTVQKPVASDAILDGAAKTATTLSMLALSSNSNNAAAIFNPYTFTVTSAWAGVSGVYAIHDAENTFSGIFSIKFRVGGSATTLSTGEVRWLAASSTTMPTLTLTHSIDTTNAKTTFRFYISPNNTYKSYRISKISEYTSGTTIATSTSTISSITGTTYSTANSITVNKAVADLDGYAIDRSYVSLRARNEITSSSNLNAVNYIKIGTYFCANNASAATLTNCPTALAFIMHVYSPMGASIDDETTTGYRYRVRKIIDYKGNEYIQQVESAATAGTFTYGAWSKIITSAGGTLSGTLESNSIIATSNEFRSTSANQFRAIYGNYGFIIRNDGSSTYFLLTNSGNQYGTFNGLRPFYIENSTGKVTMENGLNVKGGLTSSAAGNTVSIGSQNATWCHFQNSADIPFYFNKAIHSAGGFTVYNTTTSLTSGRLVVGKSSFHSDHIELYGNSYPFIDFHYNNSTSMTSRIIEEASGTLRITATVNTNNNINVGGSSYDTYKGVYAQNKMGKIGIHMAISQNAGLMWNQGGTDEAWIVYRNKNGSILFPTHNNFVFGPSTAGTSTGQVKPYTTNIMSCGASGAIWTQVFAKTTTISTSDRTQKKDIRTFDSNENYEKFFMDLKPIIYKFIDGESGRDHFGYISQDVEESLYKFGFNDKSFAGFCRDIRKVNVGEEGEEKYETVYDEDGNAQYDYALRYSEFISLNTYMIQKLVKENQELKEKNNELESRLQAIERMLEKLDV